MCALYDDVQDSFHIQFEFRCTIVSNTVYNILPFCTHTHTHWLPDHFQSILAIFYCYCRRTQHPSKQTFAWSSSQQPGKTIRNAETMQNNANNNRNFLTKINNIKSCSLVRVRTLIKYLDFERADGSQLPITVHHTKIVCARYCVCSGCLWCVAFILYLRNHAPAAKLIVFVGEIVEKLAHQSAHEISTRANMKQEKSEMELFRLAYSFRPSAGSRATLWTYNWRICSRFDCQSDVSFPMHSERIKKRCGDCHPILWTLFEEMSFLFRFGIKCAHSIAISLQSIPTDFVLLSWIT